MNAKRYVVFSLKETIWAESARFWSNDDGWTSLGNATVFSFDEVASLHPPLPDGEFVELPDAGGAS